MKYQAWQNKEFAYDLVKDESKIIAFDLSENQVRRWIADDMKPGDTFEWYK